MGRCFNSCRLTSLAYDLLNQVTMKKVFIISTLAVSLACVPADPPAGTVGDPRTARTSSPSPTPTPHAEKIDSVLQTELAKIAEAAEGRVGVGAVMVETGEAAYLDRTGRYPMQSVYKLPIGMAVLKMVDEGKVRIDQEVSIEPDDFVRQ